MTIFDEAPLRDELRRAGAFSTPSVGPGTRLNNTESPYQLPEIVSDAIEKAVISALREINRYPDRQAIALRASLAVYLGNSLGPANIWAANGASDVQLQLFTAFGGPGRTALGFAPENPRYRRTALLTGTDFSDGYRNAAYQLTPEAAKAQIRVREPDLVMIGSPNYPTGVPASLATIEVLAAESPGVVIVDETYAEFSSSESAVRLISRFPRLVVVRSLSAAFGLAGLRLGYLAAQESIVEAVSSVALPYHLSALSQAVGRAAIANAASLLGRVPTIRNERARIADGLSDLGLTVAASEANFLLFGKFREPAKVCAFLSDRGVEVRDVGLPDQLQVTVGTQLENDAFLAAIGKLPSGR